MQYRKILETGPDKEAPPGGLDAPGRWDHCLKGSRSRWPLTFRGGIPRKLGSFDLKMAILNSLPISSSLSRGFCIYSRSCARMSLYWSLMAQVHMFAYFWHHFLLLCVPLFKQECQRGEEGNESCTVLNLAGTTALSWL